MTGSAPAERAGQSAELCRAASCREPASRCDALHALLHVESARALGWSQGTEITAAPPHRRAGIWHCRHYPAHLVSRMRTESPPGSRGHPTPWDDSSPQASDASSADPLPVPGSHLALPQASMPGDSSRQLSPIPCPVLVHTRQCEVPRTKASPPQMAGRAPHWTYLRFPGQTAVPGLVGREGTLHHTAVPKVVIVTEDLQQKKEQDGQETPVSPIPCPSTCNPKPWGCHRQTGPPAPEWLLVHGTGLREQTARTACKRLWQQVTRQLGRPWGHSDVASAHLSLPQAPTRQ